MNPEFHEIPWDRGLDEITRSNSPPADRRHSSSASASTLTASDSTDSSGSRGGRRARPSVASASSQLPTVREKKEHRSVSFDQPPPLSHLNSDDTISGAGAGETVISSKKVI